MWIVCVLSLFGLTTETRVFELSGVERDVVARVLTERLESETLALCKLHGGAKRGQVLEAWLSDDLRSGPLH
jgi:hypothetical protein